MVEGQKYRPHLSRYNTLSSGRERKHWLNGSTFHIGVQKLTTVAEDLGFERGEAIPTKRAVWHTLEAFRFGIPEFPEGETPMNMAVAVYEGRFTNALLRITENPFNRETLRQDLATFTRLFVERPRFFGLNLPHPDKVLRVMAGGIGVGVAIGGVAGYLLSGDAMVAGKAATTGALIGEIGFPIGNYYGERLLLRQIPRFDEYQTASGANEALNGVQYHITKVSVQRELYAALLKEGINLTPEQFLQSVYRNMPKPIIARREKELLATRSPNELGKRMEQIALPAMLATSRTLLAMT